MGLVAAAVLAAWGGDGEERVRPRKIPVRQVVGAPGPDGSNSSYAPLGLRSWAGFLVEQARSGRFPRGPIVAGVLGVLGLAFTLVSMPFPVTSGGRRDVDT
jgi:hypothetical protein